MTRLATYPAALLPCAVLLMACGPDLPAGKAPGLQAAAVAALPVAVLSRAIAVTDANLDACLAGACGEPVTNSAVLDPYPQGTEVLVLGTAGDSVFKYVSPCNAGASGFIDPALLRKE